MERKPRWYEYDGALMRAFRTLGDLAIVNVLFILCSLPVITVGISALAMTSFYKQRCEKGRQDHTCRTFLRLWRQYGKRGIGLSFILIALTGVLILDYAFLNHSALPFSGVLLGVLYAVGVLLGMLLVYLLPVLTDLTLTWGGAIETAFQLCLMHWQRALAVVAVWVILYLLCGLFLWFLIAILPIFLLIGFSSGSYIACKWLEGI